MGEDAAREVVAKLLLGVAGKRVGLIGFSAPQRKPGLEVSLDRAIGQRTLGSPLAVRQRAGAAPGLQPQTTAMDAFAREARTTACGHPSSQGLRYGGDS